MKYYKLFWSWHEDYNFWLYSHNEDRDFQSDVTSLMKKYGGEYIKQERSWVGASRWIEYVSDKLSELGYIKITTEDFGHWGSYIIDSRKDHDDEGFIELIGKDLMIDAINHNILIRDDRVR